MNIRSPLVPILVLLAACSSPPVREGGPPVSLSCTPGAVNDLGVGKRCAVKEDCAGQWASYCDMVFAKVPMCTRMCDEDSDCGENAMCGVKRGVRKCYPRACAEFTWTPGCEKTNPMCTEPEMLNIKPGEEPKHAGAALCVAGIAWSDDGWGLRCDPNRRELHGGTCEGKPASMCQAVYYPPGTDYCEHECRREKKCGEYGYCGWMLPNRAFTICLPRCPEPRHRGLTEQPASLDLCDTEAGTVPQGKNAAGVGVRCKTKADCAGNSSATSCGLALTDVARKPDVCTMRCTTDADCGRNALCADLDFNAKGDGQQSASPRYCVPACWGL